MKIPLAVLAMGLLVPMTCALAQDATVETQSSVGDDLAVDDRHENGEMSRYPLRRAGAPEAPRLAQRKAEYRARQRLERITTLRWFGFSNARPTVSSTPTMGIYSPTWTSNSRRPYGWSGGTSCPVVVVYSDGL